MAPPYAVSLAFVKFLRWAARQFISRKNPHKDVKRITVPGQNGIHLNVDLYEPSPDPKKEQQPEEEHPLPIVINLAGAGFCLDTLGSDSPFCKRVADQVNCIVLDLDYAKAPERPWPCATEDIVAVARWLSQGGAKEHGWDGSRIAVSGFSSGGCLALLAASQMDGELKHCVCVYPSTDLGTAPADKPAVKPDKGANGSELPVWLRQFFYDMYLPDKSLDWRDPRISPINAEVTSFPPVTMITCQKDQLGREGQQMAQKLRDAGRDIEEWDVPGQGHGWDKLPGALHLDETYGLAVRRLKEAFIKTASDSTSPTPAKAPDSTSDAQP